MVIFFGHPVFRKSQEGSNQYIHAFIRVNFVCVPAHVSFSFSSLRGREGLKQKTIFAKFSGNEKKVKQNNLFFPKRGAPSRKFRLK